MNNPSLELPPEQIREKVTICIVDDFATICKIIKSILANLGFESTNIVSIYGAKASLEMEKNLEVYKSYEPGLSWKIPKVLFLDWNMPELSGIELLKKIRKYDDPRVANIITVMVTAEALKDNVILAIQSGVDNYITKPLTSGTLEKKIKEISIKIQRKVENLIQTSPDEIGAIIENLNIAIALDLGNKKAQELKRDVLGKNQETVTKIVGNKITTGKDSADKGKYSKAVGEFGNALELRPTNPKALMEYGKMMMKKTSYEEAVDSFESALRFFREDEKAPKEIREVDLLELLGESRLKLSVTLEDPGEMTESSIKTLEKAGKLYAKEKDEAGHAKSLAKIGHVHSSRAAEAQKKAQTTKDSSEATRYKQEAQGHNERAISEYEEAVKRDIKQSATLIRLSDAYKKTGKEEEAHKTMKMARELEPEDPETLIEFGKVYLDKGENQTAIEYFTTAKGKISKEDIELYEEMILCLLDHDLPGESVPFIETVAEERPDLYNSLGLAYRRKSKIKEAIEAYGKAIEHDLTGDRVGYLYNQGMAYRMAGNIASAIKNFVQAYKTDKTFEKAVAHLEKICIDLCNQGMNHLKENDKTSAVKKYKLAYVANSSSDRARNGLVRNGIDPADVLTEEELIELGIDDPTVILDDT